MKYLTKQDVEMIIKLKQEYTSKEVAQILNLKIDRVNYWLRKARIQGIPYPTVKRGRKPISLK